MGVGKGFDNYSTIRDCAHRGPHGPICPGAGGFDNGIRALSILSTKGDNNMHAPPFLRFACMTLLPVPPAHQGQGQREPPPPPPFFFFFLSPSFRFNRKSRVKKNSSFFFFF